jgi:hypothetical protein
MGLGISDWGLDGGWWLMACDWWLVGEHTVAGEERL